jgi:uncharacterized protein YbcC (UPF0753/DUF2309 family)/NADH:ubiquinone oxidoreductase subunit 5 (subunit L)/multisubunit Na+/H+ antiporter MnhA subunit
MLVLRLVRTALLVAALVSAGLLVLSVLAAAGSAIGLPAPALVPAVLLVLVTGIGALVAAYAVRNLAGQQRLARFAGLVLLAVAGLATAVLSPWLPLLALGWTLGGLAIAALVAHSGTEEARRAAATVRLRLLLGDALLWAGVLVMGLGLGTWQVSGLGAAVGTAPAGWVLAAALLVLLAGAARSALVPAHRWLPETAAAPSPVSALLHAGLVNGVGLIALLLWPLVAASAPARGLLLVLAVASVLLATAQLRTRPDVKGRLAASTSAQMGYLGIQVALGLPAAVLAHLVGHGLWKASLFLGAGGAVSRERASVPSVDGSGARRFSVVVDAVVALALVAVLAVVPGPWGAPLVEGPASLLPLAAAALAAGVAIRALRGQGHGARARGYAGALVLGAVAAYLLGLRALTTAVESTLPLATPRWGEPGAAAVLGLVVALVVVAAVAWRVDRAARVGGHRKLVARAGRTSLPPAAPEELVGGRPAAVVPAVDAPTVPEQERARAQVRVAADLVAPVWPLDAFVASSPLAGLERLAFDDALEVASRAWGSATGPDAESLRRAVEAGRISPADIDDALVAAGLRSGAQVVAGGRSLPAVMVARHLVLADSGPAQPELSPLDLLAGEPAGERAARRARILADHLAARAAGTTDWPGPSSVWAALREEPGLDAALWVDGAQAAVAALPAEPDAAVAVLLDQLAVPVEARVALLSRLLARDPGWPAHLAWRARTGLAGSEPVGDPATAPARDLLELVAVRLALEVVVVSAYAPEVLGAAATWPALPWPGVASSDERRRAELERGCAALGVEAASVTAEEVEGLVALVREVDGLGLDRLRRAAWEESWRAPVLGELAARAQALAASGRPVGSDGSRGEAQVVTCIDVRSERLRRRLEAAGPWETFGFAGFFGLPLTHVSPSGTPSERCPAILRPSTTVHESAAGSRSGTWTTVETGESAHAVEARLFAPFALAEAAGWVVGPVSFARTAAPAAWERAGAATQRRLGAPGPGDLHVLREHTDGPGFDLDEAVGLAAGFLGAAGMSDLAPLVVLCGHGGHAANNPHVAAYDCGACGGQSGDVSARAMVQVLNDPRVRAGMAEAGTVVPDGTWFAAAVHDTTRDRVEVLDRDLVPASHRDLLARLEADLAAACDEVVAERYADLPGAPTRRTTAGRRRHLERRAVDWAQPRPEWGLAGNAAIVIGPRMLTSTLDLDGRVFLQSYRADLDADGAALEALLTGPLVVAQWISQQYWCSTVDPERFGAGDKTTHNVLGPADGRPATLSGVLTGARGDLRIGLPWQAVSAYAPVDGRWTHAPAHEPLRLLAVVCAAPDAIDQVLARHPEVARLVVGEWISLTSVDPVTGELRRHDPRRGWVGEGAPEPSSARASSAG